MKKPGNIGEEFIKLAHFEGWGMIQVESHLNSFKSPITVNMIADIKVRILSTVWVSKVQKLDFQKLMGDGNV